MFDDATYKINKGDVRCDYTICLLYINNVVRWVKLSTMLIDVKYNHKVEKS